MGSEISLTGFSVVLVEQSGKARYSAVVVPGRVTGVLQVGLGVPHVGSVGREFLSSGVESLLFQGEQG